jgi:transcriptional regulator with XRE-family HTH domain
MWQDFWKRADQLRKARGVSAQRISEASLLSRNAYLASKKADSPPGFELLEGMARVLDVDVHYLVTGYGDPRPFVPDEERAKTSDWTDADVVRLARTNGLPEPTVRLIQQKLRPNPHLGVERLSHLFERADAFRRAQSAKKTRRAKEKSETRQGSTKAPAAPGPKTRKKPAA